MAKLELLTSRCGPLGAIRKLMDAKKVLLWDSGGKNVQCAWGLGEGSMGANVG